MTVNRVAYLEVAEHIRSQIISGNLAAGDRLPSEAELCSAFNVSRSTIREALRMLSSQRLVMTSRGVGGGTSVARLGRRDVAEMLEDSLVVLTRSDGASVAELLEARDVLEVPAARLAAVRHTPDQLAQLRESIPDQVGAIPSAQIFAVNRAFHELILNMAGNRLLHVVTEPLFRVMQTRFLRDHADAAFWLEVTGDHRAILEAVAAGDSERAGHEMAQHLLHLRSTYEAIDAEAMRTR